MILTHAEIREKIACPQLGDDHYGAWGALPFDVRLAIYGLLVELEGVDPTVRMFRLFYDAGIKDFAERLKAKAYKSCEWWPILHAVDAKDIDELVAEMEGENGRA
jgi:hypothetical protein